jgi:hypothetical protein
MPKKPSLDVNRREVRDEIQRTGGNQVDVDRPSTPTGKKAERVAAKLQGVSHELPRQQSHDRKKGAHGTKSRKKHAA